MTESGKIDWACHANDAAASIHDVLEMSNGVGADKFGGVFDNTEIFHKLADLTHVK